ncbi:putative leader peptide [Streptomyces sp. NBC_00005]|uniref:putative leader peptide n=1 Tax=Streptomyces sp. NBC_00005 TaxID=2903609 RepID=UPI00386A9AA6
MTTQLSLSRGDRTEAHPMTRVLRLRVLNPRRRVRLHSRPHIDLQRVAGALCCS